MRIVALVEQACGNEDLGPGRGLHVRDTAERVLQMEDSSAALAAGIADREAPACGIAVLGSPGLGIPVIPEAHTATLYSMTKQSCPVGVEPENIAERGHPARSP